MPVVVHPPTGPVSNDSALVGLCGNRAEMLARREQLLERILRDGTELDRVEEQLLAAERTNSVRGGVALCVTEDETLTRVVAVGREVTRQAQAWRVNTGDWHVSLYGDGIRTYRNVPPSPGPGLSRAEATDLAERWVAGGRSLLRGAELSD